MRVLKHRSPVPEMFGPSLPVSSSSVRCPTWWKGTQESSIGALQVRVNWQPIAPEANELPDRVPEMLSMVPRVVGEFPPCDPTLATLKPTFQHAPAEEG